MSLLTFWKPKREASVLLFRDDREIKAISLPVTDRYMVDQKKSRAWGLHSSLLYPFKGKMHGILIEHDCGPISLDGEQWASEMDPIVSEQYNKKLMRIKKESSGEKRQNLILTMGLILTIAIVILVLAGLVSSGRFHLPTLMRFG
jgi:hypothetical protein